MLLSYENELYVLGGLPPSALDFEDEVSQWDLANLTYPADESYFMKLDTHSNLWQPVPCKGLKSWLPIDYERTGMSG